MTIDNIKGTCLRSVIAYLDKAGLLEGARSRLSAPSRDLFSSNLIATGWYPVEHYLELLDKVGEVRASVSDDVFVNIGRHIINEGLSTVYRAFLPVPSPVEAVKRGHYLWRTYFSNSQIEVAELAEGRALLRVLGEPRTTANFCETKRGGMLEALTLSGAKDPEVSHPKCAAKGFSSCEFELRWKA